MLADYGISQKEYQEASNDKEIAMRLSDALDEIANGKIAVFGKMVEEAKQAKNETARQKGLEFTDYLNELRKGIKLQGEVNGKTVWTKGFDEIFKEKELQRMLAEYGISQKEYQEAKNDKEVAMRLSDALDEIANGKIAVFGKMVEEAKQAKNGTAIQKWQFEQDKAFSDLINELGGEGKFGKLLTGIISAIFNKWHGFGKSK